MNFKFDSATGFLITKAMEKLIGNNTSQDVNINITQSTNKDSVEKTPRTASRSRVVPPRKNENSPRIAQTLPHNSYLQTNDAVNAGGKIFGGELYGVLGELKSAISVPMGMAKGIYGKYKEKRETKQDNKHESLLEKENENQSKSLEEILKEVKQNGGSGTKVSLGKGVFGAGILGALNGLLFKGGWKGLLKRLGIAGVILSAFDGYGASLQKIADEQGVDVSSLGISGKFQALFNNLGGGVVKFLNMLGAEISPSAVENLTETTRTNVNSALSNLKDNYPKFGDALVSLLGATDDALGKATTWIEDATAVALDAFRKKSDPEKEYIKAQDTVRNYDTFGSTLSGTNKAEYEQAKTKKIELAQQLVKDEDVKKNSPYYKHMLKDVDPKRIAKENLKKDQTKLKEIVTVYRSKQKEISNLEQLKADAKSNDLITSTMAKTEIGARNLLAQSFEDDLRDKKILLEQQSKLVDTAKKIVLEAERALEEIKSTSSTSEATGTSGGAMNGSASSAIFNKAKRQVTYEDGTIKTGGHRNWRNNNAGNIEYGKFSKSHGAIGTDGRFAIFPSMDAGYKAQTALLKTKNYRNKTLKGAINRYAPRSENDTGAYISSVTKRTGISANTRMSSLSDKQLDSIVRAMAIHEGMKAGVVTHKNTEIAKNSTNYTPEKLDGIDIKYYKTPNADHGKRRETTSILTHRTAGSGFHPKDKRATNRGIAGHFTIEKDGTINQQVPDENIAYHSKGGWNEKSIGIEVVGRHISQMKNEKGVYNKGYNSHSWDKTGGWEPITKKQKQSLEKLSLSLVKKYNISEDNIFGHAEVAKKTKGEGVEARKIVQANLRANSKTKIAKISNQNNKQTTKTATVLKAMMNTPTPKQEKITKVATNNTELKKDSKTGAESNSTSIAPLVKAVLESNGKVIKAIEKGTKIAQAKTETKEPSIIVNIENKSTNQNIGGMV